MKAKLEIAVVSAACLREGVIGTTRERERERAKSNFGTTRRSHFELLLLEYVPR